MRQFFLMLFLIAVFFVVEGNISAALSNDDETKGATCLQRYAAAKSSFDRRCRPAFSDLTYEASCRAYCNSGHGDPTTCRESCSECQTYLTEMHETEGCSRSK